MVETRLSPAVPFERSFWVRPGQLLAGYYPGDVDPAQEGTKVRALLACGVRSFVDLTHPGDRDHRGQALASYTPALKRVAAEQGIAWTYRRCSIVDETAPTHELMKEILDAIDGFIAAGQPVYVHCWGGRGRTGTAAGCWGARHGLGTGPAARAALRELRERGGGLDLEYPTDRSQRDFVERWRAGQ